MIILDICVVQSKNRIDLIPFRQIGTETDEEGRVLSSNDWIHDLLSRLTTHTEDTEMRDLIEKYRREHDSESDRLILGDVDILLATLKELKKNSGLLDHKLSSLSETEREELRETERLIDENLFDYYFQPIVNTVDGEIYSYEALMRPKSTLKLTPLHILKYAGLVNRLQDIERGTFLNILGIIDTRKDDFWGRLVFINSIPEARLNVEDFRRVTEMLLKHADTSVVEMTEQTEIDDESVDSLKERYRKMGVRMAIDDYGSGYSNAGNLLRYMPNYVKIDRSLLSSIQESPNKRHFVREIIQFCHDNDILALAEGVETAEELRTVILLGADLVQGYFTAKPSPEIIASIPEDIRQMIKRFRNERENGIGQQMYIADCSERIMLERIVKSDIKCVIIGANGDGDVTLEGTPDLDSQTRIETRKGFTGRIKLENAWLTSIRDKPCIDIAEDCDVTLVLIGENKLDLGGIRVPESSRLTVEGDGRLEINLHSAEYYGIGNGIGLLHGELTFQQSGRITVNARGETGVAIGSGSGGIININAGQYRLNLQGDVCLGIGSVYFESTLVIHDCDIGIQMNSARGTAIGSVGRNCDITIFKTSTKLFMSGIDLVGIGTLSGEAARIEIREASAIITVNGEFCSGMAALEGRTDVTVKMASLRITAAGRQAIGTGGFSGNTDIRQDTSDTHVTIDTQINVSDFVDRDRVSNSNGQFILTLNGEDVIVSN